MSLFISEPFHPSIHLFRYKHGVISVTYSTASYSATPSLPFTRPIAAGRHGQKYLASIKHAKRYYMIGCPVDCMQPFPSTRFLQVTHTGTHKQRGRNPAASIQIHLPPFPPLAFHHPGLSLFFPNSSHRQNKPTLGLSSGPRQDRTTEPNQVDSAKPNPQATVLRGSSTRYYLSTRLYPPTHAAQQTHAYGLHGNHPTPPASTYLDRTPQHDRPTASTHRNTPRDLHIPTRAHT